MRNQTQILKKGGIYGAAGVRAGGRGAGGLDNGSVSLHKDSGRGPQPASGAKSKWGKVPASERSASLRCYHSRKLAFLKAGLTVKGEPRKRVFKKYFTPEAKRLAHNARSKKWIRNRAQQRLKQGLTWNGTPRVNRQFPELRGLASTDRTEYSRQTYHVLKAREARTVISALVAGGGNAAVLLQLKGGAR